MNRGWVAAIACCVGGAILLAVILGAIGIGGLDDVTRSILKGIGLLGLWTLRPILLLLGLLAAGMVTLGNWLSGLFGGGDLTGLEMARLQIQEFHESLRDVEGNSPPSAILTILQWLALLIAIALAGWILFRMFRRRRLVAGTQAEGEVRESTFSWQGVGQDFADTLSGWLGRASGLGRRRPPPVSPREVYHRMLEVALAVGFPRRRAQTPQEHRQEVSETLPDPPVSRIVGGFQRHFYGGRENAASTEDMSSLLEDLDELERR